MSESNSDVTLRIGQMILSTRQGLDADPTSHFLENDEEVTLLVQQARGFGLKIVLTQGTFDLIHIGHGRYVREAKKHGDLLVVGLDDDEKARGRKGPNRPVVPYVERREMLCHLRYVDAVTMKRNTDPRWHLIKLVNPDVLIAVEGTYKDAEIEELKEFCGQVIVLHRQAETSTSAKVRTLVHDGAEVLTRILKQEIPGFVDSVYEKLRKEGVS